MDFEDNVENPIHDDDLRNNNCLGIIATCNLFAAANLPPAVAVCLIDWLIDYLGSKCQRMTMTPGTSSGDQNKRRRHQPNQKTRTWWFVPSLRPIAHNNEKILSIWWTKKLWHYLNDKEYLSLLWETHSFLFRYIIIIIIIIVPIFHPFHIVSIHTNDRRRRRFNILRIHIVIILVVGHHIRNDQ